MNISERLQQLRKKSGLTLRELSEQVNITAAALSSYEKGTKEPSLSFTMKLAKFYGVSIDWLCGLSDAPSSEDTPRTVSRADILQHLTALCEAKIPVSIKTEQYPSSELIAPTPSSGYSSVTPVLTLRLDSAWLREFSEKYERLLRLYLEGEIDAEMLQAWKEKRLAACKDNYSMTDFDDDLPF